MVTSKQGEVLGAINGVRALTEGFGPLLFSFLFWQTENTFLPGCPYLIAAVVCVSALVLSFELPESVDDDDAGLLLGPYGKDAEGGGAEELLGLLASDDDEEEDGEELVAGVSRPAVDAAPAPATVGGNVRRKKGLEL